MVCSYVAGLCFRVLITRLCADGPSLLCRAEAASILGQLCAEDRASLEYLLPSLAQMLRSASWDARVAAGKAVYEVSSRCSDGAQQPRIVFVLAC